MKGKFFTYFFKVLCATCLFFSSCSNEGEKDVQANENIVSTISVECVKPTAFVSSRDDSASQYPGDVEPITIDSFNTESILYISQMGAAVDPFFSDTENNADSYCYKYQFFENEEANWNNEFNFKTIPGWNPIYWKTVRSLGSVGNAFSFYSLYFPVDNSVKFSVKKNQQGDNGNIYDDSNFRVSDILGAYHATSALYSRLRFRLYHLMVYLKVTLYVPVFETTDNNGDFTHSGFKENSILGGFVLNANTNFNIEWRTNRSSDTDPPLTFTNGEKSNITMYIHEPDNEELEISGLKQYYPASKDDTDKVRAYNFSVLFPGQKFSGNFLCFVLKDTYDQERYYYFNSSQWVGSDSADFDLTQGSLQQIYLYLPRKTNETILIGAKILPWSQGVTDMTVTKDNEGTIDEDLVD